MFYITRCIYIILFSSMFPLFAFADQKFALSDDLTLTAGFSLSNALQTDGTSFQIKNTPDQGEDNQPTSAMAHFPKYLSLYSSLKAKNIGSVHVRVDYFWNIPLNLSLYQRAQAVHEFLIRDLYVNVPLDKYKLNIWAGVRTFEFTPVTLFALPNPFDQVGLQGFGVGSDNLQFSFSLNQGHVNTIATTMVNSPDLNGNLVPTEELLVDQNGNPVYYGATEYIASIFLSGKLLLAEGRLFEPIFAFRFYFGGHSKGAQPDNTNIYKAKASSALIAGGIFSRPISNGIAGTTTLWFSSLPSDTPVVSATLPINDTYAGAGRVAPNTPMNTIGIIDSSEFYFLKESGLLTAFYLTNNTYPSSLPILKATGDGNNLEPDGAGTSDSNNKLSLGLEPLFFLSRNLIGGVDLNLNYVSEKLFYDDVNSGIISPFLKWAFDAKLNSEQYLFTSVSYGLYDWKIKKLSDGSQTNKLFTVQVGGTLSF